MDPAENMAGPARKYVPTKSEGMGPVPPSPEALQTAQGSSSKTVLYAEE